MATRVRSMSESDKESLYPRTARQRHISIAMQEAPLPQVDEHARMCMRGVIIGRAADDAVHAIASMCISVSPPSS